jgi:hypothetical protein
MPQPGSHTHLSSDLRQDTHNTLIGTSYIREQPELANQYSFARRIYAALKGTSNKIYYPGDIFSDSQVSHPSSTAKLMRLAAPITRYPMPLALFSSLKETLELTPIPQLEPDCTSQYRLQSYPSP